MSEYHCLVDMQSAVLFPSAKKELWSHSLDYDPINKRMVRRIPESMTKMVHVSKELVPNHLFQVPCDTLVSSESCYQNTQMLNLIR